MIYYIIQMIIIIYYKSHDLQYQHEKMWFYLYIFYFLGILFTCFCVTVKKTVKKCFPEDVAQQNLIVSNTEGPGEEVMVNQISPFLVW